MSFVQYIVSSKRARISWVLLFVSCILSRILTTVSYFEDPDSLRFALAVKDFDILALQPHFPGYPVYIVLVRFFFVLTGKMSVAFSLVGGIATFLLILGVIRLNRRHLLKIPELLIGSLIFFNPLFWMMSNRYMPDLLGLSILFLALGLYDHTRKGNTWFFVLAGMLAGVRLSYIPFLFLPVIYLLLKKKVVLKDVLAGIISIMVWLIPMVVDTGITELYQAATTQAEGHFYEWGGSVITDPATSDRIYSFFHGLLAHGFGLWWPERSLITLVPTIILLSILVYSCLKKESLPVLSGWIWYSTVIYAIWVFFFQNILYNPRHLMPLVVILAIMFGYFLSYRSYVISIGFMIFYIVITGVLVVQHKKPSAISQAATDLKKIIHEDDHLISSPVVNFYLDKHGVKGEKLDYGREIVEGKTYYVIGNFDMNERVADSTWFYYHNPYVNLIWPTIKVSRFEK